MRSFLLLASLTWMALSGAPQDSGTASKPPVSPVVLHMTAKNFEFDPPEVHVRQGAAVELHIVSSDHTHGIHIAPFPDGGKPNTAPGLSFTDGEDCYKLKKDEEVVVHFTGMDVGTYSFKCCKLCGTGHKRMTGKIIVDPIN